MSEGPITVGKYEMRNCVAAGTSTQIWEVVETGTAMQLAMKMMLNDARKDPVEKAVLKHEFKVGKSLEHPAFLQFRELEMNRDHAFIIMDFFRSPSLKTHITSNLPAIQSVFPKLAESLVQAFQYMHETGWLHRDIKPDNILVNKAGEVRVIDFSLSSKIKGTVSKLLFGKQKSIQGTRTYIAPETILKKAPTEQTDMYSLGVSFFEVLTGQPPFAGDSPSALLKKHLGEDVVPPSIYNENVTKELDRIILRMLEKKPAKRYANMQELASAFRTVNFFEVDPSELHEQTLKELKKTQADSIDQRLDSRADADRVSQGIAAPAKHRKKIKISEKLLQEEEERKAKLAAKQQGTVPQQPMYQPQMPMQPGMYPNPPMQPGMMYPAMPGQPMQQPHPGYPQMPPGQQMPPQQMPPQQMPPQQMPPQQMPPQQMPPQQMPPVQPGVPQPTGQTLSAPPPAGQIPAKNPEEVTTEDLMDLMAELEIE
ncbi:MAG TPA: serine/threonine protein kinase [Fuerstia sp.]|nr:serine/threonine protein kinase [Fuerstiella sp.]